MFPRNFRKEILVHFFATQMRAALDSRYHKYRNHNRYLHRVGFQKLQPAAIPGRSVLVKKASTVWSRGIFSWFRLSLLFLNYCKMAKRAFYAKYVRTSICSRHFFAHELTRESRDFYERMHGRKSHHIILQTKSSKLLVKIGICWSQTRECLIVFKWHISFWYWQ